MQIDATALKSFKAFSSACECGNCKHIYIDFRVTIPNVYVDKTTGPYFDVILDRKFLKMGNEADWNDQGVKDNVIVQHNKTKKT